MTFYKQRYFDKTCASGVITVRRKMYWVFVILKVPAMYYSLGGVSSTL